MRYCVASSHACGSIEADAHTAPCQNASTGDVVRVYGPISEDGATALRIASQTGAYAYILLCNTDGCNDPSTDPCVPSTGTPPQTSMSLLGDVSAAFADVDQAVHDMEIAITVCVLYLYLYVLLPSSISIHDQVTYTLCNMQAAVHDSCPTCTARISHIVDIATGTVMFDVQIYDRRLRLRALQGVTPPLGTQGVTVTVFIPGSNAVSMTELTQALDDPGFGTNVASHLQEAPGFQNVRPAPYGASHLYSDGIAVAVLGGAIGGALAAVICLTCALLCCMKCNKSKTSIAPDPESDKEPVQDAAPEPMQG
jgi:hypothetical protein